MDSAQRLSHTSPYNPKLALFAGIGSVWVFVLVSLGAFTTTIGAGMAFPDWPLSNGSLNPDGWLDNINMFAEHSHRLSGSTMGLITLVLAIWLWRTESRVWLRRLGWAALAIVIIQGILGGTRVLLDPIHVPGFEMTLGQMLRIPHGVLAQLYVCLLFAIAVSCSKSWIERPVPVSDGVRKAGVVASALLVLQLCVAATMRHNSAGLVIPYFPASTYDGHLLPTAWDFRVVLQFSHRVIACILAVALIIFFLRISRDRGTTPAMHFASGCMIGLLALQITLGAEIIWTFRRPVMTTGHVVVGSLLLATTFWLTWVAHRDRIESPTRV